jgi:hypothetical protein
MTGNKPTNPTARRLLALALALPVLALASAPAAASDSGKDVIWMRVQVNDQGGDHTKVRVNLPLSLIDVVIESIDKGQFMADLTHEHPSIDIQKLWGQIRKMQGEDFVTIESDDANVRVWKDKEFFRINVREAGYDEPNIEVKLPLAVMDYVFEKVNDRSFSFQDLVDQLRGHLPLTLVQAKHGEESVKISLEQE